MATSSLAITPQFEVEDPLAYLPCSAVGIYRNREIIYTHAQPSTRVYLVIEGKVKISRLVDGQSPVVVDIYTSDEFFGESAMLHMPHRMEEAAAVEETKVMSWSMVDIDDIISRKPRLGVALLQIMAQRTVGLTRRIESFAVDTIARRLARSLIRFAERMGNAEESGAIHMPPLTHELLAQYVGTSREIITHYMTEFRRQGYIRYSRKGISVHRDAFLEWVRRDVQEAA